MSTISFVSSTDRAKVLAQNKSLLVAHLITGQTPPQLNLGEFSLQKLLVGKKNNVSSAKLPKFAYE